MRTSLPFAGERGRGIGRTALTVGVPCLLLGIAMGIVLMRGERSSSAAAPVVTIGAASAVPSDTIDPAGHDAYLRARTAVDDGIARGVWSTDDRNALRALLVSVPGPLRFEIVSPLIVAVNAGKVQFRGRGPLF